jgi:hypothetical protein
MLDRDAPRGAVLVRHGNAGRRRGGVVRLWCRTRIFSPGLVDSQHCDPSHLLLVQGVTERTGGLSRPRERSSASCATRHRVDCGAPWTAVHSLWVTPSAVGRFAVFSVLSENEPDIRRRAARGEARQLMQQLDAAPSADAKGRVLEELMAVILHPDLIVSQRRLRLGDQQIDLVVDNHVDHGLWEKLESPFFLVECKNWASSVGTDEIRDFGTKVRDHQPHARLGILVAVGGFSRKARTALARASREPYQLVLVRREDLEELIDTGFEVLPWLQDLIARFG